MGGEAEGGDEGLELEAVAHAGQAVGVAGEVEEAAGPPGEREDAQEGLVVEAVGLAAAQGGDEAGGDLDADAAVGRASEGVEVHALRDEREGRVRPVLVAERQERMGDPRGEAQLDHLEEPLDEQRGDGRGLVQGRRHEAGHVQVRMGHEHEVEPRGRLARDAHLAAAAVLRLAAHEDAHAMGVGRERGTHPVDALEVLGAIPRGRARHAAVPHVVGEADGA